MTLTYTGNLSTSLDKVRFYISDKVASSGPLPSGGNFTDDELNGLITAEGTWQRAVAAAFETLAAAWSTYADIAVGSRRESLSQIASSFQKQADSWRKKYGSASSAGSRAMIRVDGYSDDVASDDV